MLPFQSMVMSWLLGASPGRGIGGNEVSYELGMITIEFMRKSAAVMLTAAGLAIGAAPSRAQGLLEQCWPASALGARPEEKSPRRGAPGHAQSIPKVALAPAGKVAPELQGSVRRVAVAKGRKLVALTFDLCEQPGEIAGYDGAIIDTLRAQDIKATFFTGGKWLLTHAERAQQLMADPRFEVGNHGWAHRNVRGLEGRALADEMLGPQAAYEATRAKLAARQCVAAAPQSLAQVPRRISLYRFPYGACNPQALAFAAEHGLVAVQWDLSTGDPDPHQPASAIVRAVVSHVRPGSIVLMHANGRGYHTAEALPALIAQLRAKGYEPVTVSELLAAGRPDITQTCYDARPGDTDRYDRLFTAFRTEVQRAR
jgi:peptidoglycan/xylan/chitin deacetylase (PgdA/CDA1 family)